MILQYATLALVLVILVGLHKLLKTLKGIKMTLNELQAAVAAEDTVIDSVIVLLGQLSALIVANSADPVAIQKIADDINAKKDALAAAVVANTPVA